MDRVIKLRGVTPKEIRGKASTRYYRITKTVNNILWGSENDKLNSLYVGSYYYGTTEEIRILC